MSLPSAYTLAPLRAGIKPFRLHWYPRLKSTNAHAAELRRRGELYAPALVLTGHQLAGRGRGANTWWSGAGSLTATFVLAAEEHLLPQQIPLLAGLAVREAVARLTGTDDIQLKWPNDILYHGKKLGGLLCERVNRADLVGLGLNVNINMKRVPASLRPRITGLSQIVKRSFDMTDVLIAIARQLHTTLSRRRERLFTEQMREYNRHLSLLGKQVTVIGSDTEPAVSGRCEGVDDLGRLLLKDHTRTHRIIAGHVLVR